MQHIAAVKPGRCSDPQAVDLLALVAEMHGVLQDYCVRFWGEMSAVQYAKGLVATPFPLCSMSIGVHLSAPFIVRAACALNPRPKAGFAYALAATLHLHRRPCQCGSHPSRR